MTGRDGRLGAGANGGREGRVGREKFLDGTCASPSRATPARAGPRQPEQGHEDDAESITYLEAVATAPGALNQRATCYKNVCKIA